MIDITPLRNYVQKLHNEGMTWRELCEILGYKDISSLKRALGLQEYWSSSRYKHKITRQLIKRDTAEKLCRALNLYPVDIGL